MKKIISILFILLILCLTACNNQIVETSISINNTEQIETTSTAETMKTSETKTETLQTFETTTKNKTDEEQINILKDQIISQKNKSAFIELPSRILFTQPKSKDILMGNTYTSVLGSYVSYYSKADGENYIYCFDPLCDHQNCGAFGLPISSAVLCNERFYTAMMKSFSSFAFDGTDKRNISLPEEFEGCTFWNLYTYAEYLYIEALMPTGEQHILQYNTKNESCIDLTEKTGNYINIDFFYNDIIYGYDNGLPIQCDLHFENVQEAEDFRFQYDLIEGSRFIGKCTEEKNHNGEITIAHLGIQIYDMKTNEKILISTETIGHEVSRVIYADDNYIYFLAYEWHLIGQTAGGQNLNNQSSGKIYRINRDGTNCVCVFEDKNIDFQKSPIAIYGNTILVYAKQIGVVNGIAQTWNAGIYSGTINEDGTIDSLEWVEVIS